jgi:dihydropteroate synthase
MSANAPVTEGARAALEVRGRRFPWGVRTYIMGIVNVTPDSFSGDGCLEPAAAVAHALAQIEAGADFLDIGAESTRPGSTPIDATEELRRLLPVIRGVREQTPEAVISIDTFKPQVFAAARSAGGDVLNSIWGLDDALMAEAASTQAPVVIMHNKRVAVYEGDVVDEVLAFLENQANRAVRAGLRPEHVILDPGIGFGKSPDQNLAILAALERLVTLGFPTLLGTSRKSTLGKLTGKPVGERVFATAATVALAIAAGIDVVRVHDVASIADVVVVADAIVRGRRPAGWPDLPS